MDLSDAPTPVAADERQLLYARLVGGWTHAGTALLLAAFAVALAGWLPPGVPFARQAQLWQLPAAGFLARTGGSAGWSLLQHASAGDLLNLLGIAWLCSGPPLCLLPLLPSLRRDGQRAQVFFVVALAALAGLAAVGW